MQALYIPHSVQTKSAQRLPSQTQYNINQNYDMVGLQNWSVKLRKIKSMACSCFVCHIVESHKLM